MKSSICSPRTIRKFFLVGSGSPINLYTTKYDCILPPAFYRRPILHKRVSASNCKNATLEEFVKTSGTKTRYSFIYGEEVRLNGRITLPSETLLLTKFSESF